MPTHHQEELSSHHNSTNIASSHPFVYALQGDEAAAEIEPLLSGAPSRLFGTVSRKRSSIREDELLGQDPEQFRRRHNLGQATDEQHNNLVYSFDSEDDITFYDFIMEKVRSSKVAHWADKLAVESEPG
jgi:hypothetical protein